MSFPPGPRRTRPVRPDGPTATLPPLRTMRTAWANVPGAETKFQPVFVGDVARAVVAALQGPGGQTFELGGPQVFSMLQLNQWIAKATGHNKLFVPVPDAAAKLLSFIPGGPISGDQLKMLASDNVVSGADGLAALGITATPLDAVAHDWMTLYRKHGRFGDAAAA